MPQLRKCCYAKSKTALSLWNGRQNLSGNSSNKKIKIKEEACRGRKKFISYILVDMVVTDDSWYVVTPRVTGFVGSGVYPVPLTKRN